jgi:hypothetical protein
MALRMSCLIHGILLLLLLGCAGHTIRSTTGPILLNTLPDQEIAEGRTFVGAVADKMPMWDGDDISRYERVEIATVKADIAMAQQMEEKGPVKQPFLACVSKLHNDWDALVAWDEMLKKESLT